MGRAEFTFWDLGGQAALRALWAKYYEEAHGLVYVVDSEDAERLGESRRVLHEVVQDEALRSAPVLVLANKQDGRHACPVELVARELNVAALEASGRAVRTAGVSALTGTGVREAVGWVLGQVRGAG